MSEDTQNWLAKEIQEIRNSSIPHMHKRIDEIGSDIKGIFGLLNDQRVWQAAMDERVKPLLGLEVKHALVNDKVAIHSRIFWGVWGAIVTAFGAVLTQIFGKGSP